MTGFTKAPGAKGATRRGGVGRAVLAATLMGGAFQAPAVAQQGVSFEGQGGVALPAGRLAKLADAGPSGGLQLAYHLGPRVALGLEGEVDMLSGAELAGGAKAPDMRLWRYGGGLSADLLPSERWALVTSLGAGATRFSSDRFRPAGATADQEFAHTYFTTGAGMKLGYSLSSRVTTYVGAKGNWASTSVEDSRALASLDPALKPLSSAWSVPVTVGMNVKTGGGRRQTAVGRPAASNPRPASSDAADRERRETEARRLCEQAEAALQAGEYQRARELYRRAKSEYPGTLCANAADAQLEKVAAVETIRERVHFEYDRHRITPEAAKVLERKAAVLRKHPELRVTIEGHCDERGSLEYNQVLGQRRADSTRRFLATLGVSESMFDTRSYGKERPLVDGVGEAVWSQNRRAEFLIQNLGAL